MSEPRMAKMVRITADGDGAFGLTVGDLRRWLHEVEYEAEKQGVDPDSIRVTYRVMASYSPLTNIQTDVPLRAT